MLGDVHYLTKCSFLFSFSFWETKKSFGLLKGKGYGKGLFFVSGIMYEKCQWGVCMVLQ